MWEKAAASPLLPICCQHLHCSPATFPDQQSQIHPLPEIYLKFTQIYICKISLHPLFLSSELRLFCHAFEKRVTLVTCHRQFFGFSAKFRDFQAILGHFRQFQAILGHFQAKFSANFFLPRQPSPPQKSFFSCMVVLLGLVKMVVDRPGVDQLFIAGYANLVPIVLLG